MFFLALTVVSVALAVCWQVWPPLYFTNDDVMFRLLIEGRAVPNQPPTGFLISAHSALGWALVWVHAHSPIHFTWDWTLASVLVVGVATLMTVALSASDGWAPRGTAILAVLVPVVPLASGVQFTISATIAGGAACALACQEIDHRTPMRVMVIVSSSVLLLAGLLVRPLAATAGALVAGAVFVLTTWAAGSLTGQACRRCVVAGLTVVAMFAAVSYANALPYRSSPEWRLAYDNHARIVSLFDWSGGLTDEDAQTVRAATGWTPNDLELLRRWWGVDPVLHGPDRVMRAYDAFRQRRGPNQGPMFGMLLRPFNAVAFGDTLKQSAPAFIAIAMLVGVNWTRRRALGAAAAILGAAAFYFVVQVATKDLPSYLVGPLCVCVVGGVIAARGPARETRAPLIYAGLVLLGALVAWEAQQTVAYSVAENRQAEDVRSQVIELNQQHPSLVVGHADAFPIEYWWRPFHDPPFRLAFIELSFDNQMPVLQRFLSSNHLQPFLRAMCVDPGIVVVSEEDRLRVVSRYWSEHLHADVNWTRVFDGTFRAWRCSVVNSVPGRLEFPGGETGKF